MLREMKQIAERLRSVRMALERSDGRLLVWIRIVRRSSILRDLPVLQGFPGARLALAMPRIRRTRGRHFGPKIPLAPAYS